MCESEVRLKMTKDRRLPETGKRIMSNNPGILEETLSGLLAERQQLTVLEVGFGLGCTLLDLAVRFRENKVAFYGIDKGQKGVIRKRDDLKKLSNRTKFFRMWS